MSRAFTLIELLVVVAIVAVLAGMLLPAVALVKRQAHAAACMSSLRQLGLGFEVYKNDWEGLHPDQQVNRYGWYTLHWFSLIAPLADERVAAMTEDATFERRIAELDRSIVWGCPEWRRERPAALAGGLYAKTGYGMNYQPALGNLAKPCADQYNGFYGGPFCDAKVGPLAKRVLFAETRNQFALLSPDNWAAPTAWGTNGGDPRRHGATMNHLFYDQHAAALPVGRNSWHALTDPANPAWEP
ncbi:MAG: prepilin-type N-terminal cleavage/methylation domain-containing protein [Planctomycetes bacterium]|nr:prepilin-type N-terminal cleavage/methylation domain-containing protein [Planctomycetota bacterium]